jgi:hypothetical protein
MAKTNLMLLSHLCSPSRRIVYSLILFFPLELVLSNQTERRRTPRQTRHQRTFLLISGFRMNKARPVLKRGCEGEEDVRLWPSPLTFPP